MSQAKKQRKLAVQNEMPGLGNRIKEIRKSLNLTQAQFAEKLGLHQLTVTRYEGGRPPKLEVLAAILRIAPHVSASWLLSGEGELSSGGGGLPDEETQEHINYLLQQVVSLQKRLRHYEAAGKNPFADDPGLSEAWASLPEKTRQGLRAAIMRPSVPQQEKKPPRASRAK